MNKNSVLQKLEKTFPLFDFQINESPDKFIITITAEVLFSSFDKLSISSEVISLISGKMTHLIFKTIEIKNA
jgi:hypothetical protein